jgi:ribonuclease P protein component
VVEQTEKFRAAQKLRSSRQFETVYLKGARVHSSTLVLYGLLNSLDYPRLGLTVSRKIGKAVIRNRVKRRVREIFRTKLQASGPGIDLVVNAKRPIVAAPFPQIRQELQDGLAKLSKLLSNPPHAPSG